MLQAKFEIVSLDSEEIVFDFHGYSFPFANALRRIILSEVPTMAIEKIHLYQNTSVMHDEFLGHRLGLIPIKADPDKFDWVNPNQVTDVKKEAEIVYGGEEEDNAVEDEKTRDSLYNENNSIILMLNVQNPSTSKENLHVYTSHLEWQRQGNQGVTFASEPIKPVHGDILITKLAPSQHVEAKLYCIKGIGKDHAKYSPVSACYYKYLTTLSFVPGTEFTRQEIDQLKICFPKGHLQFDDNPSGLDESKDSHPQQPTIVEPRMATSDSSFMSCTSLADKINIQTDKSVLTCKLRLLYV